MPKSRKPKEGVGTRLSVTLNEAMQQIADVMVRGNIEEIRAKVLPEVRKILGRVGVEMESRKFGITFLGVNRCAILTYNKNGVHKEVSDVIIAINFEVIMATSREEVKAAGISFEGMTLEEMRLAMKPFLREQRFYRIESIRGLGRRGKEEEEGNSVFLLRLSFGFVPISRSSLELRLRDATSPFSAVERD